MNALDAGILAFVDRVSPSLLPHDLLHLLSSLARIPGDLLPEGVGALRYATTIAVASQDEEDATEAKDLSCRLMYQGEPTQAQEDWAMAYTVVLGISGGEFGPDLADSVRFCIRSAIAAVVASAGLDEAEVARFVLHKLAPRPAGSLQQQVADILSGRQDGVWSWTS